VTVTAHIDSDAGSKPLFSGCGWATNGFTNFNCFKDNGTEVYSVGFGEGSTTCVSYYYCFPAWERMAVWFNWWSRSEENGGWDESVPRFWLIFHLSPFD
jgi:hypothetical protein